MRTTFNIDEHLLAEARRYATKEKRSVSALVEDALRELLGRRRTLRHEPFELPTFGGSGTLPGFPIDDPSLWAGQLDEMDWRDRLTRESDPDDPR